MGIDPHMMHDLAKKEKYPFDVENNLLYSTPDQSA